MSTTILARTAHVSVKRWAPVEVGVPSSSTRRMSRRDRRKRGRAERHGANVPVIDAQIRSVGLWPRCYR